MRVAMDTGNSVNNIKCIHVFFNIHAYKNMLIKVCVKFHCNATNNKDVMRIVYELPNRPSYNAKTKTRETAKPKRSTYMYNETQYTSNSVSFYEDDLMRNIFGYYV